MSPPHTDRRVNRREDVRVDLAERVAGSLFQVGRSEIPVAVAEQDRRQIVCV